MAGAFVAGAAGAAAAPRLARIVGGGTSRSALAGTLAQAIVYLALAASGAFVLAAPAFVAVYMLNGVRGPFHHELLHEHVAAEQRSTMLSAASLSAMAGGLVANLTLPLAEDAVGIPWTWAAVAALLASSSLLYRHIDDRPSPPADQSKTE